MTETSPSSNQLDPVFRGQLEGLITPIVQANGGEIVDVEWKLESGEWILRIYLEKLGALAKSMSTKEAAVTLDLCADVAKALSPALDALEERFPHAYNLEVSSPGVERPLKKREDFARFKGEKAKLWLLNAAKPRGVETGNGQRVIEGVIETGGDAIVLRDGSRLFDVPFETVDRARLVFDMGSGTKKGKPITKGRTKHPKSDQGKHPGKQQ